MELTDLSSEDQALLLAFIDVAREQCGDRSWSELEPLFAQCWEGRQGTQTSLHWRQVSKYVQNACGK